MSRKHSNISVFVPHIGCPNKCSFCDQRYITGRTIAPTPDEVKNAVEIAVSNEKYDPNTTEIAFFGGSFTAIDRQYMLSLLEAAYPYVAEGKVKGIRISTRPDAVNDEILSVLKAYSVSAIELGAQSLDDGVLSVNKRGHTAEDVKNASYLVKNSGFELGLQMMTGLYTDTCEKSLDTARKIIELKPDTVRIYPTVVLKGTDLARLYLSGLYLPQSLEDAVSLASKLYTMFVSENIRVIRLGLHSIVKEAFVAGPWHPAFSELCLSRIMLEKVLEAVSEKGKYTVFVSPSDVSKMVGQKRGNIAILEEKGFEFQVKTDELLGNLQIRVEREV